MDLKILDTHNHFSPLNRELVDVLSRNREMRCRKLILDDARVTPYMRSYVYRVSPWPVIISHDRRADFRQLVKSIPRLIYSNISKFFGGDAQLFEQYFELPGFLLTMLKERPIDVTDLLVRYDVVFNERQPRILEVNAGSTIGGWQLSLLPWKFSDVLSDYAATKNWTLTHTNTVEQLLSSVWASISRWKGSEAKGNVLFYLQETDGGKEVYESLREIYGSLKPPEFSSGNIFFFSDFSKLTFDNVGRVYFSNSLIDAVLLGETKDEITVDRQVFLQLTASHMSHHIFLPDNPLNFLLANKLNLAILHDLEERGLLSREDSELVKRYIPWTARFRDEPNCTTTVGQSFKERVILQKNRYVLKKASSSSGRDVVVGIRTDEQTWRHTAESLFGKEDWLVQEFCASDSLYAVDDGELIAHDVVWGLFGIADDYGGAWVRMSRCGESDGVINSARGALEAIVLEENPAISGETTKVIYAST